MDDTTIRILTTKIYTTMTTLATINNTGMNMMTINNMTATRMATILDRTQDAIMAVGKSMMIETLKTKMANGIAHFAFKKKDGSIREAWGTIQENIAAAKTNGNGISREYYKTTAFFDIEKGEWKSFRWESLIWIE
jgi:hypothetical protein